MKIAVNAISAKVGGAATYLANVLPELRDRAAERSPPGRLIVWRGGEGEGDAWPSGIDYRADEGASARSGVAGTLRRVQFDQIDLPRALRAEGVDVLFSTANFGPLICPCRQVLLVRNTIYFDETFLRRAPFKVRANYLLQRALVLASMAAADVVLFPSRAMLDLAADHAGGAKSSWRVAPYGTRQDLFGPKGAPEGAAGPLARPIRLLNVSLYCDQKNLGTLLRALKRLDEADPGEHHLDLTAGFRRDELADNPMCPAFREERALFQELHARGAADDTNWKTYTTLPDLYRGADIFVFSSYTESFGHPLIEAMATGLPIVASDIPVNRELCGGAAEYFSTFDPESCASAIRRVAGDPRLRQTMRAEALRRAERFTWKAHVDALMETFSRYAA